MKKVFKRSRGRLTAGFALIVAAALVGCSAGSGDDASSSPTSATAPMTETPSDSAADSAADEPVTLKAVIDGDTIETSEGTVRLIGIDTPERDECGYEQAATAIGRLLAVGDPIVLELPTGQNDRDRHDRLLRYVSTSEGIDIGLMQIEAGNAIARYDSRDGYPAHPKEASYHAAQIATRDANGSVVTTACRQAAATPLSAPSPEPNAAPRSTPTPEPAPEPTSAGEQWWLQYSSCSKLKKNTVGHPKGPFDINNPAEVEIYNWFQYGTGHRGDGDGDGLACE